MIEFYRFKSFSEKKNVHHAVTTKSDLHPYTFSLALHTGEETESIVKNRRTLAHTLAMKENVHFVVANQTHSDHIKVIHAQESKGWESLDDVIEDCDALITQEKNIILTILTADCVPILLYDPKKEVIAAVHAGWKGTKAKIAAKTVLEMQIMFGCKAENILAGVGPAIGKCCYEVGEDVAEHFLDLPGGYEKQEEKYQLDLPYINKYQLLETGLSEAHIEMSRVCTACETERFFSYRKEQGCSGRFMSLIGMSEDADEV